MARDNFARMERMERVGIIGSDRWRWRNPSIGHGVVLQGALKKYQVKELDNSLTNNTK